MFSSRSNPLSVSVASSHANKATATSPATLLFTQSVRFPLSSFLPSNVEKRKVAHGSSFTTPEDEAITEAWIHVSENSIIGSDQKREAFNRSINKIYGRFKLSYYQNRTCESVKKKMKKILQEYLYFGSHIARTTNN